MRAHGGLRGFIGFTGFHGFLGGLGGVFYEVLYGFVGLQDLQGL